MAFAYGSSSSLAGLQRRPAPRVVRARAPGSRSAGRGRRRAGSRARRSRPPRAAGSVVSRPVVVEQAQLDRVGDLGEEREVGAHAVVRRAQRVRRPGPHLHLRSSSSTGTSVPPGVLEPNAPGAAGVRRGGRPRRGGRLGSAAVSRTRRSGRAGSRRRARRRPCGRRRCWWPSRRWSSGSCGPAGARDLGRRVRAGQRRLRRPRGRAGGAHGHPGTAATTGSSSTGWRSTR